MKLDKFDLAGKTALITGAGGLLGLEHAAALLECGCDVVLTDISETALEAGLSQLKKSYDSGVVTIKKMDVTEVSAIIEVAKELASAGCRIDILINNAAVDPKVKAEKSTVEGTRFENFSSEQWDFELAVGLTGAFLCSQVFGSAMAADGNGGVILNISSDLSVFSPDQRIYRRDGVEEHEQPVKPVTYSVIKTGLIGLTRYLATYWAADAIRVNALSPGGVLNGQDEAFITKLSSLIPLGRMADKSEYRSAIQFLCSDASSYMNGQNIVMDGGRSIW